MGCHLGRVQVSLATGQRPPLLFFLLQYGPLQQSKCVRRARENNSKIRKVTLHRFCRSLFVGQESHGLAHTKGEGSEAAPLPPIHTLPYPLLLYPIPNPSCPLGMHSTAPWIPPSLIST